MVILSFWPIFWGILIGLAVYQLLAFFGSISILGIKATNELCEQSGDIKSWKGTVAIIICFVLFGIGAVILSSADSVFKSEEQIVQQTTFEPPYKPHLINGVWQ
jgi:hypothetical protein